MRTRGPALGLVALALALAAPPASAQGGVLRLDSATIAALTDVQARIETAERLRLLTPGSASVLVAPRLLPSGLGYASATDDDPRLDGRAFRLQARGRASRTGRIIGAIALGAAGAAFGFIGSGLACLDAERRCNSYAGLYGFGFAVAPLRGQERVLLLDSASLAALTRIRTRVEGVAGLRLATPSGAAVLVAPRLGPRGLEYAALVGTLPQVGPGGRFALQTRDRATATGIAVGAGMLATAAVAVGLIGAGCFDRSSQCTDPVSGSLVAAVAGAALGAAIGGVIGALVPRWRTVFRYPVDAF